MGMGKIAQPEFPKDNRQAVWLSDMVVALVLKATLRNLPVDSITSAQVLAAAQILQISAGAGTLDLMQLNANHGVLVLVDTVLSQPWVQAQCEHFQVIIVVSKGKQYITYYRRTKLLAGQIEGDGRLWLQELKAKQHLEDSTRREEPRRTTWSARQPPEI